MKHRQKHDARGALLVEALVAFALLGVVVAGAATMIHNAARVGREAERLDVALNIGDAILARFATVGFHGLPDVFAARADATAARLDSTAEEAPADWLPLLEDLPDGRIVAVLEGAGPGGAPARFDAALALRVRVEVSWSEGQRRRQLELIDVRF